MSNYFCPRCQRGTDMHMGKFVSCEACRRELMQSVSAPVMPPVIDLHDIQQVQFCLSAWWKEMMDQRARVEQLAHQVANLCPTQIVIEGSVGSQMLQFLKQIKEEQKRPVPHLPRAARSISL